jgi:DNA polymerase III delta subunit
MRWIGGYRSELPYTAVASNRARRSGWARCPATDLLAAHSEIEKWWCTRTEVQIDVRMVEDMAARAGRRAYSCWWTLSLSGESGFARHRLDVMYQKGLSAGYVFTMIARQFRLIAQIHETRARREAAASSVELERLQSFALQKASEQASRYTPARVRDGLERIVAADRGIKSGMQTARVALELLVSDLLRPVAS